MKTPPCALAAALVLGAAPLAFGQHAAAPPPPPRPAYQLEFVLTVQPAGQPAQVETYSMVVQEGSAGNSIRTHTKTPYPQGPNGFAYADSGVTVHCTLPYHGAPAGRIALKTELEVDGAQPAASGKLGVVSSSASAAVQTVVPVGQRRVIASFSNATLHTRYQLAVEAQAAARR